MPHYIKKDNKYLASSNVTTEHYDDDYSMMYETHNSINQWVKDVEFAKKFYTDVEARYYFNYHKKSLSGAEVVKEKF